MTTPKVLLPDDQPTKRPPRVDLKFEQMIICCAIGCIIQDMPMSNNDYIRMYLAFSRLSKKQ